MELDIETTDRLLNAILFCLGPSLEDESIREKPWLHELQNHTMSLWINCLMNGSYFTISIYNFNNPGVPDLP